MNEAINDIITYDELINAVELDDVDSDIRTAANYLIEALTDWPVHDFNQPVDLVIALMGEIEAELTYDNLCNYMNIVNARKNDDDTWKGSSIAGLLKIFELEKKANAGKAITLNDLILIISNHYSNK